MSLSENLFPNLVHLHWHNHPETDFHHITSFLSRKILHIAFTYSSASHLSVLSTLPHKCPALTSVVIRGSGLPFPASVCVFLGGLPCLQRLEIPALEVASLEQIGRLESLKWLVLYNLPLQLPISAIHGPLFLNLHDLSLESVTFETTTQFFGICTDATLRPVTVPVSLVSLDLGPKGSPISQTIRQNIRSYVINTATLRILFCFGNLTNVRIQSPGFDLDDATILEMAHSWPRLLALKLVTHQSIIKPRVTLQGLRFLARHCSHLESLHMTFDASTIPDTADSAEGHISQTSLVFLHVADSPIVAPLPVARFLSGIFPSLTSISVSVSVSVSGLLFGPASDSDDISPFQSQWKDVQSHIPLMLAVREEGRIWAQQSS
ncbi:hypothetical protein B0H19DRAFT_1271469 [Mycena capillaripes]|nr:hypothetical protein B0H19DRAFT_1271469 [Mycena capillaripes]